MLVYYNGRYVSKSEVGISPDDRGFLFADGIYEVIRAYDGHLFRLADHLSRLRYGVTALGINGVQPDEIGEISGRLIAENDLSEGDATVYIQITRGASPRSHKFPSPATLPTVYLEPRRFNPPVEEPRSGARVILVPDQRWARCDLKTTGLLPNTLAHQKAFECGAYEAIFCRDGMLMEGTHSSILFVQEDTIVAPPLTNYILPSVTRQVVLELAQAESIPVLMRSIRQEDLGMFDEMLIIGTTVEITPVVQVEDRPIGNGKPGPITQKLQAAFAEAVRRERVGSVT